MSDPTDYLIKLTCAVRAAQKAGYTHTAKALESMRSNEVFRLSQDAIARNDHAFHITYDA